MSVAQNDSISTYVDGEQNRIEEYDKKWAPHYLRRIRTRRPWSKYFPESNWQEGYW